MKNLKNVTGLKALTRNDQKSISGGYANSLSASCSCDGCVGEWTGTYSDYNAMFNSITKYCRTGSGHCTVSNNPT